jgi:PPOX class probable F420-dependent enzyme
MADVLTDSQRTFAETLRRAILATTAPDGRSRLVPICFTLAGARNETEPTLLYSPLDEKPKQAGDVRALARVRDILDRPEVTLLFEHWSEDWSKLAWLRVRGQATLIEPTDDPLTYGAIVEALRRKYPQYREQRIEARPMIRVTTTQAVSWSASG